MDFAHFDSRPVIVAIAGSNGSGKTTFFHSHLADAGLRFVNADDLSEELDLSGYAGATMAAALRSALLQRGESFVFETVFSDQVREKVNFLVEAVDAGYTVVLIFIGISGPDVSEERVAMRVSMGGHDVPPEKVQARFPRTLENLKAAIRELPHVIVYDNNDLAAPYREVAVFRDGATIMLSDPVPKWLRKATPGPDTPG